MAKSGQEPSVPYEPKPPDWIVLTTKDGDLGYHGYHPPQPGRDEEILSESNILNGYFEPHFVAGELWQGTETFGGVFKQTSKNGLDSLQDIMAKVLAKRAQLHAVVDPNSFKLPSRVTFASDKRAVWFKDLADSTFPLQRLAKSVPVGYKTIEFIEMLYSSSTPVDRTFWYIHVLGAIDIQARTRNTPRPSTSIEWTNVITAYMKRQLLETAIPTVVKTSSAISRQNVRKSKLSDPEGRDEWVARYAYSLDLLRLFYDGDLLDQPTFLTWLASLSTGADGLSPHQFVFVVRLVDEYFDLVASNRAFSTPIIEGCLLQWIEAESSAPQYAKFISNEIATLVLRFLCTNGDLFITRTVATHRSTLSEIIAHAFALLDPDHVDRLRGTVTGKLQNLLDRATATISITLPQDDDTSEVQTRLRDIESLNDLDVSTDLSAFEFLPQPMQSAMGNLDFRIFSRRLATLLSWATHPDQAGNPEARPYIACSLIALWKQRAIAAVPNTSQVLQRYLLAWLEEKGLLRPLLTTALKSPLSSGITREKGEMEAILSLFGDLVRRRLFSFSDFLTRMTSYGNSTSPQNGDTPDPLQQGMSPFTMSTDFDHLSLLRFIPLWEKVPDQVLSQRKIVLYGIRIKKTREDLTEKEIRAEIRGVLPVLFNGPTASEPFSKERLQRTLVANKFVQARVLHHWLLDLVKGHIARMSAISDLHPTPVLALSDYRILTDIFAWTGCYFAIWELNRMMLQHTSDDDLLSAVLSCFRLYLDIWVGTLLVDQLTQNLLEANARLKEQMRKSSKNILTFLSELKASCILSPAIMGLIDYEQEEARRVLAPEISTFSPAPPLLPHILAAVQNDSLTQPGDLATTIWYKNREHADWGSASWQAVIAAINGRSWNLSIQNTEMAHRFAQFVSSVDAHLPDGLGHVIKTWFETTGVVALLQATDEVWLTLRDMCLSLAFDGVIAPGLLLDGFVYPQWQLALRHRDYDHHQWPRLQRTLNLVSILVNCSSQHLDTRDSRLETYLETSRVRIIHPSHIHTLVDGIVTLFILKHNQETNSAVQLRLKSFLSELLDDAFVSRNILSRVKLLRNSFHRALDAYPNCRTGLINDFRLCLRCEATKDLEPNNLMGLQWALILDKIDVWTFEKISLDLKLVQQLLHLKDSTEDGLFGRFQHQAALDEFANALINHPLTASTTALLRELLKDADPILISKIILKGLGKLRETFSVAFSNLDDLPASLRSVKEVFRLVVTFGQLQKTSEAEWPLNERDEFLGIWMDQMSALKTAIQSHREHSIGIHNICDAICLMARVIHFVIEIIGPSLGPKAVGFIALLIEIAILVGGGIVYDEITCQLLLDTVCIFYDDCSKDIKGQLVKVLSERFPTTSLPSTLPLQVRIRLDSILPFIPHDKLAAGLARAQRTGGLYELTSHLRGRPWEWIPSIEPRDEPTPLATRVRNTAVMPLELFGSTSRGEAISSETDGDHSGDVWSFRDSIASEDLLTRAWKESRVAWDVKSLDGIEKSGASAFSPGASRTSVYMTTSSGMTSPIAAYPRGPQPSSAPTVETLIAEPMDVEPSRGLKRKVRLDDEGDGDEVMVISEQPKSGRTIKPKEKNKK
ncbi:RNA polymerase II mediator complex subunit [Serendipita sp. 398]|nr:RNA polymerase II mediator complex subunit [Serendipita sp. 398]